MSKYVKRERVCNLCYECKYSCKETAIIEECINYSKGYTRFEYLDFIKEQNINVKKLCTRNGLSYNIMMNMLNGRTLLNYKYTYYLDSAIFEKTEYLKDIERFANG